MLLEYSYNNTIMENRFKQNNPTAIRLSESWNNLIYRNNFFYDGEPQAVTDLFPNSWNNSCEGNYWNYSCVGVGGICDTPHYLDANNIDYYPLMGPIWQASNREFADIDHDKKVRIYDVVWVCGVYRINGTANPDRWNCQCERADLDGNKVIEIYDVVKVCAVYNEEYKEW